MTCNKANTITVTWQNLWVKFIKRQDSSSLCGSVLIFVNVRQPLITFDQVTLWLAYNYLLHVTNFISNFLNFTMGLLSNHTINTEHMMKQRMIILHKIANGMIIVNCVRGVKARIHPLTSTGIVGIVRINFLESARLRCAAKWSVIARGCTVYQIVLASCGDVASAVVAKDDRGLQQLQQQDGPCYVCIHDSDPGSRLPQLVRRYAIVRSLHKYYVTFKWHRFVFIGFCVSF